MSLSVAEQVEHAMGIGASDSAAAVRLSKWKTQYKLFRRKLELDPPDEREELHLEMGQVLEPMIVNRFAKKQKVTVVDRQLKIVDPENPWRWVTLDGRVAETGAHVEAKSVGMADPAEWGDEMTDNEVPMEYFIQCQHGLACNPAAPYTWLPMVVLNRQFRVYRIQRDPDLITLMTAQEKEFMRMLEAREPPPPQDMEDISLMWPSHRDAKKVEASKDLAILVSTFKDSKAKVKEMVDAQEEMKLLIARHIGDAAELVFAGKTIVTYKQAKASMKFQVDQFQVDHPALYDKYLREVPGSRRMLTK